MMKDGASTSTSIKGYGADVAGGGGGVNGDNTGHHHLHGKEEGRLKRKHEKRYGHRRHKYHHPPSASSSSRQYHGKLKGTRAVWMARDLEDDGSSLWYDMYACEI
jgi:hypothetical protein